MALSSPRTFFLPEDNNLSIKIVIKYHFMYTEPSKLMRYEFFRFYYSMEIGLLDF